MTNLNLIQKRYSKQLNQQINMISRSIVKFLFFLNITKLMFRKIIVTTKRN